jgi:hypothetical protein
VIVWSHLRCATVVALTPAITRVAVRVVLEALLDRLGGLVAGKAPDEREGEVDACGDTGGGENLGFVDDGLLGLVWPRRS